MTKDKINKEKLVLLGAGGHAKVVIEIIKKYYPQYHIVGITEKEHIKVGQILAGVNIIGTDEDLEILYNKGVRKALITLGTVGNYKPRLHLFKKLKKLGFQCPNIIHKKSMISEGMDIGEGNVIAAGAIINADAVIGNNSIINTGSIIEHDCKIGNNVHIAPGVNLSGEVAVKNNTMIGTGSSIIQGITIGENSLIGAGSVVVTDIPPNVVAVGNPAKIIKNR